MQITEVPATVCGEKSGTYCLGCIHYNKCGIIDDDQGDVDIATNPEGDRS